MKWISVKNKLPEEGEYVIAAAKNKEGKEKICIISYYQQEGWQDDNLYDHRWTLSGIAIDDIYTVSAWMNFPEFPKKERK